MDRLSSPSRPADGIDEPARSTTDREETPETEVRRLIHRVTMRPEPPSHPGLARPNAAEDVVLDVEVDGYRCLVIRVGGRPLVHPALSPREQEIARMVAKGYPNKTIARVLDISTWTVGTHLRRIFAKLGVGSRAAMVARLMGDSSPRT